MNTNTRIMYGVLGFIAGALMSGLGMLIAAGGHGSYIFALCISLPSWFTLAVLTSSGGLLSLTWIWVAPGIQWGLTTYWLCGIWLKDRVSGIYLSCFAALNLMLVGLMAIPKLGFFEFLNSSERTIVIIINVLISSICIIIGMIIMRKSKPARE